MLLQIIRKFDLIGKFYASSLGKKWIHNKLKSVLPHLDKNEKNLDIGCGNGMITHTLRQQGFPCTPLDVADLAIMPDVDVIVYDGLIMPFEEKEFDAALLLTVLHHTPDPVPVLKETARVAKKIIIIEDIVDTGLTMESLLNKLKTMSVNSVEVATLLLKPDALYCKLLVVLKSHYL